MNVLEEAVEVQRRLNELPAEIRRLVVGVELPAARGSGVVARVRLVPKRSKRIVGSAGKLSSRGTPVKSPEKSLAMKRYWARRRKEEKRGKKKAE